MSAPLHHDTAKGLAYWSNIKQRAKDKDTELFKHFEGRTTAYTFDRIIEIADKMTSELIQIETEQEDES